MNANLENVVLAEVIEVDKAVCVEPQTEAIVIVGSGPVGMRLASELASRKISQPVVVYGSEPVAPYNRVRLSDYLAGDIYRDSLTIDEIDSQGITIEYRYNCAVESIDREARTITDASGCRQRYSKLVLVTGSTPFMPNIGNSHYRGVYTFRTLNEADELLSRKVRTRHTVVIGGGLLGLETARAMQKFNIEVTIIEHSKWLMMQQLDEDGSNYLEQSVIEQGMNVITGDSVVSITGNHLVEGVTLRSGKKLACDTVIVAAGIRPNITLASEAGLICHKGIRVNSELQTSDDDIYAIGECAQHEGNVYGLVRPGFEQAAVLADRLSGGDSSYRGSTEATQLKVMSQAVFSAGRTGVDEEIKSYVKEHVYRDEDHGIYRKIRVFGNRIIGAVAIGEWHESSLIKEAVEQRTNIWLWHLLRFKTSGNVWGTVEDINVSTWPASATVCNCTGVNRGRLSNAISDGCENLICLTKVTQAGSVCGSCKPLLAEMLGKHMETEPARAWRSQLAISMMGLLLAVVIVFAWRIPYADSVEHAIRWDMLWRDQLFKQISGFTMLGLFTIGLLVSLRKRMTRFTFGDYDLWRIAHMVLGIAALVVLIAHTGFRFGNELNLLLMINFVLLAVVGANASTVVATEHRLTPSLAKTQRKLWNNVHLLLFWTLPVLLGFHVLKTYYF